MAASGSPGRSLGWILFALVALAAAGIAALWYVAPDTREGGLLRAIGVETEVRERHFIPEGYVGWLTVRYGIADRPPLERDGEVLVFRYPESGVIETSTPGPTALGTKEYFTYGPSGVVPVPDTWMGRRIREPYALSMVHDDQPGAPTSEHSSGFFIGTREEYHRAGPSPALSLPVLEGIDLETLDGSADTPVGEGRTEK